MQADQVNVAELAERLGVSTSAVSRILNADGDISATTAALLADAMGWVWTVELRPKPKAPG